MQSERGAVEWGSPQSLVEESHVTSSVYWQQEPNLRHQRPIMMAGVKGEGFGKQDYGRIQGESEMSHCSKLQSQKEREQEQNKEAAQKTDIILHTQNLTAE